LKIQEIENEIVEEFEIFEDDWMQKYEHIIELGKSLPLLTEDLKTDDKLIKGCQSRVWLHANFNNGIMSFMADSDAIITKGLVALIVRVFNNQSPHDIMAAQLNFINKIGLTEHLTPTRANGLLSMVQTMKELASRV